MGGKIFESVTMVTEAVTHPNEDKTARSPFLNVSRSSYTDYPTIQEAEHMARKIAWSRRDLPRRLE
jgi:hypothetical protein